MNNDPFNIVLADDDEGDRLLFIEALKDLKIKVDVNTVNDGVYLMEYLAKEDTPLPFLLFLDLNMPRKNGLQCLKEIRATEKLREVPVAIYSTSSTEADIEKTFLNGANVYIKKPNDFSSLKEVLHKVVMAAHTYREPPFNIANFLFRA
jgi:CheY-like chemotaxis protein